MRKRFLLLALVCAPAFAQTYYTDCAGVAGTSLSGTVTCPNLPNGVTTAQNPQAVINHVFPAQGQAPGSCTSGNHCYPVTAGQASGVGGLQGEINLAAADCSSHGSWVVVPSGNTYTTATYFNLPLTNCDATHWVIIQSDHLSLLPPQGTRISASATNMPTLGTSAPTSYSVIIAADNPATPLNAVGGACTATGGGPSTVPCGYWLAGLDVEDDPPNSGANQLSLINLGDYCAQIGGGGCPITSGMSSKNLASRFVIDRCWIHPTSATSNILHGIRFSASWVAVEDSIVEAHYTTTGQTAQTTGISSDYTMGPIDIGNNEILAVTENILFGGTDPTITNSVPSDIYIHQNYIHKRASWMDAGGANYFQPQMRNWIECKNCQRMLIEGNVFDTVAVNGTSGAFTFTPRNISGTGTWAVTQDVTMRYNKASNLSDWIGIAGTNGATPGGSQGPELPAKRFSIHDNVVENLDDITYGGNGIWINLIAGNQTSLVHDCSTTGTACDTSDIVISHNTLAGADSSHTHKFFSMAGTPTAGNLAYHMVITNNIGPAGFTGFTSDCGTAHPITGFLNCQWSDLGSGSVFDRNVITGITTPGFGVTDFPSPICNYSGTTGCTGVNALGFASTMSGLNFVNYNSGVGGDYHLCITSSVPSGCSAQNIYEDTATDSFSDNTKEGPSPGANIDAVNQMTAGVVTGNYTIQSFRAYGPVKGQQQEMRQWVKFPGYYDAAVADGSGNSNFLSFNSGGDPESWAGIAVFHDLQHDPAALINLSGANVGLKGNDYTLSTGSVCGLAAGGHITDSKAFWGQVTLQSVNNVRAIYKYRGPLIDNNNNHVNACGNTSIMWNYLWTMARPGFVNTRYSFDNGSGSSITFSPFQPRMSTSTYTFNQIAEAAKYPPSYGVGWSDGAWNVTHCQGTVPPADYDPGSGIPWGFLGATGWMMHSITSTTTNGGGFVGGITDGYTTLCNGDTKHYPITAEFLNIEFDNAGAVNSSNYQEQAAGGGVRSSLNNLVTIGTTPTVDTLVQRSCGWYGDLAIRNSITATELAAECQTPVAPTMNAGTSPSFDHDHGCWNMAADATPKVDFTLNHTWTSPMLCITSWNGTAPTVIVNGFTQTANVNYVFSTNDGSGDPISTGAAGLLLEFVGLPTNGSGGMVALPAATHIIVNSGAGTLPGGSKVAPGAKGAQGTKIALR